MKVSIEDIRRQYAELSDEGLLEIEREDLVEQARRCYDEELSRRKLKAASPATTQFAKREQIPEDLVVVAEYLSPEDGQLALELVRSAGITAFLGNEHFAGNLRAAGLPLRVPASDLEFAREVLEAKVSDEELAAAADTSYIRHGVGAVRPYIYGGPDLLDFVQRVFDASVIEESGERVGVKIADSVVVLELSDPPRSAAERAQTYVYVPDVDEAYERALEARGTSLTEPADTSNGERSGSVKDSFGNTWWIATYTGA